MRVIGLTGGIGSGKSTVARLLADAGAVVVDADAAAREVLGPGEPALEQVAARFGRHLLREDRSLDREALADVVFADPEARTALEAITHPRIGERIAARLAAVAAAEEADGRERLVVLDHPLLVESGQAGAYDVVVVVEAPEEVRVARLVERGLRPEDARARIAAQASDEQRRAVATHVVDNGGDLAMLRARVAEVAAELGLGARA